MDRQELERIRKLAGILKQMYDHPEPARWTRTGRAREKTMVHLFGILYAQEIRECGDSLTPTAQEIVQAAGIPPSYDMDVIRGLLLAEYVTVHDRRVSKWRA